MLINKSYKYRIYPNKDQREIFAKHFGCVRFVYNHFLRQRIDWYAEHQNDTKKGLNYFDTSKMLTQLKKQQEYIWLNEVSAQSLQQSLRNLDRAYNNFFNKYAMFPKFKKKHNKQSFSVPQKWSVIDEKLNIPKCKGIKIICHRPMEGIQKFVTINYTPSGKYYAIILCELEVPEPNYVGNEIGIDFGIKAFITTSDNEVIENPQYLRTTQKQLKRLHRAVTRKQKDSNSRRKAVNKLAKKHEKISNRRYDYHHKISLQLVRENQAIHIEDLAITNMVRNHNFAKSISDVGWGGFIDMLEYKGAWYGCHIHKLDRFFPSTKRCHKCGFINNNLTLKDREWQCPECDMVHDRDHNAAINILIFSRAGIARSQASGEG